MTGAGAREPPSPQRARSGKRPKRTTSFNTFGHMFRFTSFGESHGAAIGCVVDGCPPRILLEAADIQYELDRRRQSRLLRSARSPDTVKIMSGVFIDERSGKQVTTARRSCC